MTDYFAGIFLSIIQFTHRYTHNFGWDIIFLTVLVKGVLFPLTLSSTKSMKKMQELQPELKAIQEKYKDQKEKQSAAMMELYKTNKVNPLNGCLPLVLQIPVFIALFRLLSDPSKNGFLFVNSFFYGMDLTTSAFLRISDGFFSNVKLLLPYMVNVDITGSLGPIPLLSGLLSGGYIYLPTASLVILMAGTTFLQQKSMTVDPNQSSQFMIMNLFMVFIALSMPSGVLLYWVVSNLLQFVQQKIVKTSKPIASPAVVGAGVQGNVGVGGKIKNPVSREGESLSAKLAKSGKGKKESGGKTGGNKQRR